MKSQISSQILSMNVSHPVDVPVIYQPDAEWQGKTVRTSMHKKPISGAMHVNSLNIEGDSFDFKAHGTPDSVLYALGLTSITSYMESFGRVYSAGDLGENLTVDHLDEKEVSVGDVFKIGEVMAQATSPRIPCGKVNVRLQNLEAQKRLIQHGRSGVYFRILKPGLIQASDQMVRVEQSPHFFSIYEMYSKLTQKMPWSESEKQLVIANGAFPADFLKRIS